MRVILAPVADRPECVVALDTTFGLAAKLKCNILGVHIRPDRSKAVVLPVEAGLMPSTATMVFTETDAKTEETASKNAAKLFANMAKRHRLPLAKKPGAVNESVALWEERLGAPSFIMPIIGPVSDLVVVSRPKKKGGVKARVFLQEAVMRSHRPVLVLPQKKLKNFGRHVAIAWNRSGEAARAVANCMPLLGVAEKVSILTSGSNSKLGPNAKELAEYLLHHGISAKTVKAGNKESPEAVMDVYKKIGADLMVMGAYSRSRWSEFIFGGFTRYMLEDADIPVALLHS